MNDDLYREVTDFAQGTPGWVHTLVEYGTDGGVLILMFLLMVGWWRARSGEARAMALALIAPAATAVAYGISEVAKSVIKEDRPCRAVTDAAASIAPCPEVGDWSFPSNHSTIAAAAAVGLVVSWRATTALALPMALAMAFSRVFLGVHYPLDVSVGLLLGAVVALVVAALCVRPVTRLVTALRVGALAPLLVAGGRAGGGRHARSARPASRVPPGPTPPPVESPTMQLTLPRAAPAPTAPDATAPGPHGPPGAPSGPFPGAPAARTPPCTSRPAPRSSSPPPPHPSGPYPPHSSPPRPSAPYQNDYRDEPR